MENAAAGRGRPVHPARPGLQRRKARLLLALTPCLLFQLTAAHAAENLPLATQRQVSFTTDEGTWMSLDVAPKDGSLIFDLLGDIYTLDPRGGTAIPLISGLAFDSQPVFSPDGSRIALISDRLGEMHLWVVDRDGGNARQLSRTSADFVQWSAPAWSPDGRYVYVVRKPRRYDVADIWMYHVDGGSGLAVTKGIDKTGVPPTLRVSSADPAASPDGRFLYYASRVGAAASETMFPLWNIRRRDLSTGSEEVIIAAPGSAIRPVPSPDGKMLAYATRRGKRSALRIRNLETGEDRQIAPAVQRDAQEVTLFGGLLPGYRFTADSQSVVSAYDGKIHKIDVNTGAVVVIPFQADVNLDVGPDLRVTQRDPAGPVKVRIIQTPRQSPDGSTLAFSALGRLYSMSLRQAIAKPQVLTPQGMNAFTPVWSPDGAWIVFVTWSVEGGQVWRIRARGGTPAQLTTAAAYYQSPVFSRDGKTVYALRGSTYDKVNNYHEAGGPPPQAEDIVAIAGSGRPGAVGQVRRLATTSGAGIAEYSPDPTNLHFAGARSLLHFTADGAVIRLSEDGNYRRTVLRISEANPRFAGARLSATATKLSADGKWALARYGGQLHLIAVPPSGSEDLELDLQNSTVAHVKLTSGGADFFDWADGGRTITWSIGPVFHRIALADIRFDQRTPIRAQTFMVAVEVPRDAPSGSVLLSGATVITMRGDEVIESADLLIDGDRIAGLGPKGSIAIPPAAKVLDVSGKFIIPGFIDTHAHWVGIRRGVFDADNWTLAANLAYGVTAGLDVQTFTSDMFVYQDLVDSGRMVGPRLYSTGPGIFLEQRISSQEEAMELLKTYRDLYGTRNIKAYLMGNRSQRHWLINASHELGMMPTTEGSVDFYLDVSHAIDGFAGNEHALPVFPLYRDVVELYARTGIGYTPTLLVASGGPQGQEAFFASEDVLGNEKLRRFIPSAELERTKRRPWFHGSEYIFSDLAASAQRIYRAGGRLGVGSHGQLQGLGYHWEMQALATGGLTAHEVLQIATRGSADIIGRAAELGTLDSGKYADLVVLTKNPLADLANARAIRYVMKNGRLYDGDTLREVFIQ